MREVRQEMTKEIADVRAWVRVVGLEEGEGLTRLTIGWRSNSGRWRDVRSRRRGGYDHVVGR